MLSGKCRARYIRTSLAAASKIFNASALPTTLGQTSKRAGPQQADLHEGSRGRGARAALHRRKLLSFHWLAQR